MQTAFVGEGADRDTTFVVLRPDGTSDKGTLDGSLAGLPDVTSDGSVAVSTRSGNGTRHRTTLTVLRPDGSRDVETADGYGLWTPVSGPDGTVARLVETLDSSGQRTGTSRLIVIRPDGRNDSVAIDGVTATTTLTSAKTAPSRWLPLNLE